MKKSRPMSRNYMELRNTKVKWWLFRLPGNIQIHVISAHQIGGGGGFWLTKLFELFQNSCTHKVYL